MVNEAKIKRLYYLDNAKAIAMFLVILGHCNLPTCMPIWDNWIQSFHVPVYFVISGMLFALKEESGKPVNYEFKKRAYNYLVPFVIFSIMQAAVEAGLQLMGGDIETAQATLTSGIMNVLKLNGRAAPWFLMCLFLAEIIFVFERKHFTVKQTIVVNILLALLAIIIPHEMMVVRSVLRAFLAVACFTMGYLLCIYKAANKIEISLPKLIILFLIHLMGVLINGHTSIFGLDTGTQPIMFYPTLILGCMMFIGFAKYFCNKNYRFLSWFGSNTLIVLCTQQIMIEILYVIDNKTLHLANHAGQLMPIVYCVITILLEIPVIIIANKYFYYMFGKKQTAK